MSSYYYLLNMSTGEYVSLAQYNRGGWPRGDFQKKIWWSSPPTKAEIDKISKYLSLPPNAFDIIAMD